MNETVTVTFLNQSGNGLAEKAIVQEGTTVVGFLASQGVRLDQNQIRLSRDGESYTPTANEQLEEGDRLTAVPSEIKGA